MKVDRTIGIDGSTHDIIVLSDAEIAELDRCHEIIRDRIEEKGYVYTKEWKEVCEWWLQGILRLEGLEKMVAMAQSAPFHEHVKLITIGYAETMALEMGERHDVT